MFGPLQKLSDQWLTGVFWGRGFVRKIGELLVHDMDKMVFEREGEDI